MPEVIEYRCGHCGANICVSKGNQHSPGQYYLPKCYNCDLPTIITRHDKRYPPSGLSITVKGLPEHIGEVYKEVKDCLVIGAWTATNMLARKLLMNVAVDKGADENKAFAYYVVWMDKSEWNTTGLKLGLDRIRAKGNDANHEIKEVSKEDVEEIFELLTMFLRLVYEFPDKFSNNTV